MGLNPRLDPWIDSLTPQRLEELRRDELGPLSFERAVYWLGAIRRDLEFASSTPEEDSPETEFGEVLALLEQINGQIAQIESFSLWRLNLQFNAADRLTRPHYVPSKQLPRRELPANRLEWPAPRDVDCDYFLGACDDGDPRLPDGRSTRGHTSLSGPCPPCHDLIALWLGVLTRLRERTQNLGTNGRSG